MIAVRCDYPPSSSRRCRKLAISCLLWVRCRSSTSRMRPKPRRLSASTSIPPARGLDPGRVADDVDQPVEGMEAAQEIIVLAIGAREKCGEMTKAGALEALASVEAFEGMGVLRADAVDQDLVELAERARARDRKRQHVPERKAEIVDEHLPPRIRMPFRRDRARREDRRARGSWRRDRSRRPAARSAGRACRRAAPRTGWHRQQDASPLPTTARREKCRPPARAAPGCRMRSLSRRRSPSRRA